MQSNAGYLSSILAKCTYDVAFCSLSHYDIPLRMSTRRWQIRAGESVPPFVRMAAFHDHGDTYGMESSLQHLHKFDLRCRNEQACWDAVCTSNGKTKRR